MKKVIFAVIVFASGAAFGQANSELSGMIRHSLNYFPSVQELNTSESITSLRVDVAKSNYLPNINGNAVYSYVNPVGQVQLPISATETKLLQFQPHDNYNFNVGLNQTLWDFGRTKAQIEKAKADVLVAHQNTEAAKFQVASQVATIYYAMIYLRKSIEVQDSAIAYYANNKKIIEGRIRAGDALQIDLSTIENNIDQEKNRKVEFERQYDRQVSLMRYTTGQPATPLGKDFDFTYVPGGADVSNNPNVIAASQRIAAAEADLKLSSSNRLPSLSLQASAGYKNAYQPDIEQLRFNVLAGATLVFPLYQGGRVRQNIAIARKSAQLNEISKNNTLSTLQKDLESAQADIKAYDQQIKNSEGQIVVAKETSRLTQVRYKQGVATYLDLVSASTNLQRAYLSQIQYEYQKTLALVETCRLMGVKFWQE